MRVGFVTVGDPGRRTGGCLYNARVVRGLRDRGVPVATLIPCGASVAEQERSAHSVQLDLSGFDVVVVDALARAFAAPHLDRWRADAPVVALVHELQSIAGPARRVERERRYEGPLLRADRVIAVSEQGRAVLVERGVPGERIRVVSPGLDRLSPGECDKRERRDESARVLCVGQWIPRKGILDLLGAWRLKREPATLRLIGETDADPAHTRDVLRAMGGDPSVRALGAVDDATLREAYGDADLFVLPSRFEGYGIVYAEALAFGLPVIACRVGPVAEVVGSGAAVLVPPADVGALRGALDLVLGDPALRARMSLAARRRAAGLPTWEEAAEGFARVLQDAARAGETVSRRNRTQ